MSFALINPPSPFLINERVFPNIGLIRVATTMKKYSSHDIKVFDFAGWPNYLEGVEEMANDFDFFGISSTTPQFPYTMKILEKIREKNKDAYISLGGPHATAISSSYRLHQEGKAGWDNNIYAMSKFDNVFEGEAEGMNYKNIFVRGMRDSGIIKSIDDTLIPDRNLFSVKSYKANYMFDGEPATNIQTQRGCPFQCEFCCGREVEMYNHVRAHSPERVIEEMEYLNQNFGYKNFMWYDDEINLNQGRLEEICKRLSRRHYHHRGFIRSDLIVKHPESVKQMKKAGFVKLCAGVESGSDRMLKQINKGTTYDINLKARQIIGDENIHYEAFLMMGLPDEKMEDLDMTRQWLHEVKPDDFDINIVTPYPGSKIYNKAIPSNDFKDYKWEYKGLYFNKPDYSKEDTYYKGKGGQSMSHTRTRELSHQMLVKMRDKIEREFK